MKITIDQAMLLDIISRGAMAALSEDAQNELTNAAPIIKSVRIIADEDKIIMESGCSSSCSRYTEIFDRSANICQEKGECLVPAKDFMDWVSRQQNAKIRLVFQPYDTPKIINALSSSDGMNASSHVIKLTGKLEMVSVDATKTGNKWALDCYDLDQFGEIKDEKNSKKLFDIEVNHLKEALKSVVFASVTKDSYHVFDSIKLQSYNKELYAATTDKARLALYRLSAKNVDFSAKETGILIQAKILSTILDKLNNAETISVSYDDKSHKIFIYNNTFLVRLSTADQKLESKFSDISILIDKQYNHYCNLSGSSLLSRISTISMVNKQMADFSFKNTDKGSFLKINAASESGKSPITSTLPVESLSEDLEIKLGPQNLGDALKILKDSSIEIELPPTDRKSIKVKASSNERFTYYLMSLIPKI